jgi:hypothetical protein
MPTIRFAIQLYDYHIETPVTRQPESRANPRKMRQRVPWDRCLRSHCGSSALSSPLAADPVEAFREAALVFEGFRLRVELAVEQLAIHRQ